MSYKIDSSPPTKPTLYQEIQLNYLALLEPRAWTLSQLAT
jgi:hypothetical protein